MSEGGAIGALRVRVLPDFAGFRGAAAAEGHAAGDAMGAGLVGAVREHWKGLVAGLAVAELGKKAFDFLGESVNAFKESAVGATQLRRIIGGTVEDTSRLRFALHEMGVSNEAVNTIFGRFSRQLEVQSGTTKGLSKLTDQLGFSVRDAAGNLRPMTEILPKIADRFKELPDGAEKTALAIQLFGRSGAGMIRFLNQGSEGIKELEKESDKFGNTISTKSVADLAKYGKAHRELTAATEGLKISIGEKLMPIITQFEVYLAEKGIPALQKFGSWIKDNIIPIILDFAHFIQRDVIPPVQHLFEWLGKHPAVLKAVERGVELLVGAWAAFKIASLITSLGALATSVLGVGTAAATAATEVGALDAASAGAGGAGAARAGAARFAVPALSKAVLPIALTITAVVASKQALEEIKALGRGDFGKALNDGLNNVVLKGLTAGLSGGIAKAIKTGDPLAVITSTPGYKLLHNLLGGGLPGGKLTGELGPDFGKLTKDAESWWKAVDDRGRIKDFTSTLGGLKDQVDGNSKALIGNSAAAHINREAIGALAHKALDGADAELRLTGKQSDYNAAIRLAIPAIENAAAALGFNKQQVDDLVRSLGLVPPETTSDVQVSNYLTALNEVNTYLAALNQIPRNITTFASLVQTNAQGVPGSSLILNNPKYKAAGGIAEPGWTWVGEKGPELVNFGSPSRVLNHQDSVAASGRTAPLLNIEHWHGDQTDADGLASMLNAQQRAYAASKGI